MAGWSTYDLDDCCCQCNVTFCISTCTTSTAISGVTITVAGVGSCTTDGTGCCTISIPAAGNYHVTASKAGYVTYDAVFALSCGETALIRLSTTDTLTVVVRGCCNNALPGAIVTYQGVNYTSDSAGNVHIGMTDAGIFPLTVSAASFDLYSTSITQTLCQQQSISVVLTASSGYVCFVALDSSSHNYPWPVPTTLHLTDSVYGPVTLNWTGTEYSGSITVVYPAGCGCPARSVAITYELTSGGTCGTLVQLVISWQTRGGCPDATGPIGASVTRAVVVAAGTPFSASSSYTAGSSAAADTLYCGIGTVSYTITP